MFDYDDEDDEIDTEDLDLPLELPPINWGFSLYMNMIRVNNNFAKKSSRRLYCTLPLAAVHSMSSKVKRKPGQMSTVRHSTNPSIMKRSSKTRVNRYKKAAGKAKF
jgi:hypothetical protein